MKKVELTQERLKELLSYDPETGVFRWRVAQKRGQVKVGSIAGADTCNGYYRIGVDKCRTSVHRLAWLYVYGIWPSVEIDHINGNRRDNRIVNLRLATRQENSMNQKMRTDNTSGIKGVSWCNRGKRWKAQIRINYTNTHIGLFDTKEEARIAYETVAKKFFGEFRRTA